VAGAGAGAGVDALYPGPPADVTGAGAGAVYPGPPADVAGVGAGALAGGGAVYPPAGGMVLEVDPGFGQGVAFDMPEPVIGGAAPYEAAIAALERDRIVAVVNFIFELAKDCSILSIDMGDGLIADGEDKPSFNRSLSRKSMGRHFRIPVDSVPTV